MLLSIKSCVQLGGRTVRSQSRAVAVPARLPAGLSLGVIAHNLDLVTPATFQPTRLGSDQSPVGVQFFTALGMLSSVPPLAASLVHCQCAFQKPFAFIADPIAQAHLLLIMAVPVLTKGKGHNR